MGDQLSAGVLNVKFGQKLEQIVIIVNEQGIDFACDIVIVKILKY